MRNSRKVRIGNLVIGGGAPVAVQSMLNVPSCNIAENVAQAQRLEAAGCEILRFSVPDRQSVRLIDAIREKVKIPLVADIHFDYKIALDCAAAGVDKIRINPGNIGAPERVRAVAQACLQHKIPIRIGVNSGSLEKRLLEKHGGPTPQALCESALLQARMLQDFGLEDIVISLKSSDVRRTVEAYRLAAAACDFPLHLGVTEAGSARMGLIKSAVGIGALLCDGIGDTLRVSLTDSPEKEVEAGLNILKALNMRDGVQLISCPTCGRTRIDLISIAQQVEEAVKSIQKPITVAVMGCVVNGPGEAAEADIGIAGGDGCAVLFRHGKILRKVPENEIVKALLDEIQKL